MDRKIAEVSLCTILFLLSVDVSGYIHFHSSLPFSAHFHTFLQWTFYNQTSGKFAGSGKTENATRKGFTKGSEDIVSLRL